MCALDTGRAGGKQVTIRHIPASESQAAVSVLASAFLDDPLTVWSSPDADVRREFNHSLEAINVRCAIQRGHAYEMTDGSAVALWVSPGVELLDEAAIGEVAEIIRSADPARASFVFEGFLKILAAQPKEPHFHLTDIGVAPEAQGRGLGSRLLRDGLDHCDRYGCPAYLEATSTASAALYRRHGFEVVQEIELPDGPTLFGMWRKAGSGSP